MHVRMATPTPDRIAEKVSGEHQASKRGVRRQHGERRVDEVEEVSAAASHARQRLKELDPLENYCKDNPETDECKTYDN
ncbi:calvin cycle protein CP12-1, chloroplastic [Cinnamomum micranthum f. kanehirae]|uniref:Calvin cycle protein CP12-1, chloroplastic n=1 Tax=Cinnamomum micranthum f. kanehirae TaxID=337451 RepID=A0A443Q4J9_9MAGN|nr:calvin cycle protein CP12-1, chloroplastic [Cinnamomum micranthum f. kanehirae]